MSGAVTRASLAHPVIVHALVHARVLVRALGPVWPVVLAALVGGAAACASHPARSPAGLRAAWREAIERGDAQAAWTLLSPATQRALDEATFVAAFERDLATLRTDASASETTRDEDATRAWTATTVHPGGHRLRWALDGEGRWQVTAGLPGLVDDRDLVGVIRAFVSDLRALPTAASLRWVTQELADATRAALEERAAAIEASLADPEALLVSADGERASLRYAGGRQLLLARVDGAWRISRIE
jgi:hypothetical protein